MLALVGVYGSSSAPRALPAARLPAEESAELRKAAQALRLLQNPDQFTEADFELSASRLARSSEHAALRARVVSAARRLLISGPRGFRDDCSGLVSAVYSEAGVPMDGVVASIWDLAIEHDALHWDPKPLPGDLIFFDDTHDRNHNGRRDDILTHIGVVLSIDPDGTVEFAHGGTSRGRVIGHMNLLHPSTRKSPSGKVWNEPLRLKGDTEPEDSARLTGELWVAWGRVDPALDWKTWVRWVPLP